MIEVRVAHLGLDRTTNTPVVILQEREGERVLPIWIGPAEESAIAMELAGVKFARPLTHDLLKQVIVGLGADLHERDPPGHHLRGHGRGIRRCGRSRDARHGRSQDVPPEPRS